MFYDFFFKHFFIFFILLFLIIFFIFIEILNFKKFKNSVGINKFIDLINHKNAVIFDFRNKENFNDSHILNSINLNRSDINKNNKFLKKYKKRTIIIICYDDYSSSKILNELKVFVSDIFYLEGGFSSWLNSGLPTVKK